MKLTQEPLSRRQQILLGIAGVLGTATMAELVLRSSLIDTPGLPVPSLVIGGVGSLLGDSVFWGEVAFTLGEWMLALLMAIVVGVTLGALMGASRPAFIAFEIPVEVFRVLPSVAVGPILMIIMGPGMLPLSVTVALSCVWPILLNTMYGVRATDTTAVQTAQSLGKGPLEIVRQIRIPSALPFAFTGIRTAASIGLVVAVSAELLIGDGRGIGGYILGNTANASDLSLVYAATLVAGVLGLLVNSSFSLVDDKLLGWKKGLAQ